MTYKQFITLLQAAQTTRVKIIELDNSCAVTQVPSEFNELLVSIILLIQANIHRFCQDSELIAIFGMQVAAGYIESSTPSQLNRSFYPNNPSAHFCCSLNYLICETDEFQQINSWQNYHALIVDFTTGIIMDTQEFLHLLDNRFPLGSKYGELNQNLLEQAWSKFFKSI